MRSEARRVLIVTGNVKVREQLERIVRDEGGEAVVLQDGHEALARVAGAKPDLVILGFRLAGLDGPEVLRRLRSDPETATLRVFMLPKPRWSLAFARWQLDTNDRALAELWSESLADEVRRFLRTGKFPRRRRILVVDDERHVVRLCEVNLRRAGYHVVTAFGGQEALDEIRAETPDLIVLDDLMPQMDGFQVLKHLKAVPETRDIPLICLTAKSANADCPRVWRDGSTCYVTKPFNPMELLKCVWDLLSLPSAGPCPEEPASR